jgi:hypothetical protein
MRACQLNATLINGLLLLTMLVCRESYDWLVDDLGPYLYAGAGSSPCDERGACLGVSG